MREEKSFSSFFFTIITVCYNSEKTIRDTFESLLNQSFKDFQYIVIDAKSKDKTLDYIKDYQSKFKSKGISFKYITEKDNGIYDAMNKGIRMSIGKWIGILNSDDIYEKDTLNIVKSFISLNLTSEVVFGNMTTINSKLQKVLLLKDSNIKDIRNEMCISHPSVFIKKDIYDKFGLYNTNYKIVADWELLKRFHLENVNFQYLNKNLSFFKLGGVSSNYSYLYLKERISVRHKNLKWNFFIYDLNDLLRFALSKIKLFIHL